MGVTWRWLDDARRTSGWSEGKIADGIEAGRLLWRGYVRGQGEVTSDKFPEASIEIDFDNNKLTLWWLDRETIAGECRVIVESVEVLLPTDAEVPSPPADAEMPATDAPAVRGYQAARVDRALDDLEIAGLKLSDHTDAELRRLVLEQIPEREGGALPSRQTIDRVIQRRRGQ
jgi:hypothetical protein